MEVLLEIQDLRTVISYDVLGEMNAGNFLARRSLQDMQATEGQFWGDRVMLQAAMEGATPLDPRFKPGKRELSIREQHQVEQASQTTP